MGSVLGPAVLIQVGDSVRRGTAACHSRSRLGQQELPCTDVILGRHCLDMVLGGTELRWGNLATPHRVASFSFLCPCFNANVLTH